MILHGYVRTRERRGSWVLRGRREERRSRVVDIAVEVLLRVGVQRTRHRLVRWADRCSGLVGSSGRSSGLVGSSGRGSWLVGSGGRGSWLVRCGCRCGGLVGCGCRRHRGVGWVGRQGGRFRFGRRGDWRGDASGVVQSNIGGPREVSIGRVRRPGRVSLRRRAVRVPTRVLIELLHREVGRYGLNGTGGERSRRRRQGGRQAGNITRDDTVDSLSDSLLNLADLAWGERKKRTWIDTSTVAETESIENRFERWHQRRHSRPENGHPLNKLSKVHQIPRVVCPVNLAIRLGLGELVLLWKGVQL